MYKLLFLIILLFIPTEGMARPVSYPGGWTVMLMNNGQKNSSHIHYSPTFQTSLGYKFEHWRDKDINIHAVQMNNLLKRFNNSQSQANIYVKSGVGVAYKNNDNDVAAYSGIAMDWEDRRTFVSYNNRFTKAGDFDDFYEHAARVGITPYVGDYGDLHTWLMIDIHHMPENQDHFTITPLVRFFKDVHLFEAGFDNNGQVLLNYVVRY